MMSLILCSTVNAEARPCPCGQVIRSVLKATALIGSSLLKLGLLNAKIKLLFHSVLATFMASSKPDTLNQ